MPMPQGQATFYRDRAYARTMLVREWDGQSQRVMVMAAGFAWNGQTYDSLSKVAFAITGTRWNGTHSFASGRIDRPRERSHEGILAGPLRDLHPDGFSPCSKWPMSGRRRFRRFRTTGWWCAQSYANPSPTPNSLLRAVLQGIFREIRGFAQKRAFVAQSFQRLGRKFPRKASREFF